MIKYNGEVDKKFNDFAERYADVITVTKKRTPQELDLSGVFVASSFYFDIKLDGVLYKVIAVGDYGYGFCPYAVPKSFPKNCLTHKLTYVEDVNDYRLPDIGHNKDYYESRIVPEVLTPTDIIGDDAYFDKKKFMLSTLYSLCMDYRDVMSDALGVPAKEVFTTTQLCDFFSAFPYKSADYYQIRQDVQDDLLDIWNHYDCRT